MTLMRDHIIPYTVHLLSSKLVSGYHGNVGHVDTDEGPYHSLHCALAAK